MSSRSLNKVTLIGNLTRDPELRFTPTGTAVCTFGLATNRSWTTDSGEKREETEFHRIVSWNKLAELCSQLLAKGRKVYVEGRLQSRTWSGNDGTQHTTTEIVIEDMIILDSKRPVVEPPAVDLAVPEAVTTPKTDDSNSSAKTTTDDTTAVPAAKKTSGKKPEEKPEEKSEAPSEEINPDDIPF
ncbi:single-stranded DNA-binding protein [Candidatus Gottesmanbacteria bacterium]|nr:single-stranded DNA-binding protein [Candidatus Gottesmanbacteria bacterium]